MYQVAAFEMNVNEQKSELLLVFYRLFFKFNYVSGIKQKVKIFFNLNTTTFSSQSMNQSRLTEYHIEPMTP